MKISAAALAICVISQASAFVVQPSTSQKVAPSFSYLGNLGGDDVSRARERAESAAGGNTSLKRSDSSSVSGDAYYSKVQKAGSAGPRSMVNNDPRDAMESQLNKNIWDSKNTIHVQGGSLRTWSITSAFVERVQVVLKTEGRPLNANVELWQGTDNTPQKMSVYIEDGSLRPFCAVIETPRGSNAIAIRNTGHLEFPLAASMEAEVEDADGNGSAGLGSTTRMLAETSSPRTIQGGAIHTYPFDPSVSSVQVLLKTDCRPLNARLELLQGPNNNKQVIEIYTEDGLERPFFMVFETPGTGNVVRVVNTATVEFPMYASVEPFVIQPGLSNDDMEADGSGFFQLDRQW